MDRVEASKLLIEGYEETGSFDETAQRWHTSCYAVRKAARPSEAEG